MLFFELSIKLKKNVSQFTQKYLAAQLFFNIHNNKKHDLLKTGVLDAENLALPLQE